MLSTTLKRWTLNKSLLAPCLTAGLITAPQHAICCSRNIHGCVVVRDQSSSFKVSKYIEESSKAPDASATIINDLVVDQKRFHSVSKKATWYDALAERKKQLLHGKVLDSYSYTTPGTNEIIEKTRADSFSYLLLPFKEDKWLLDSYINAFGRLRVGQIFQDLDALAGKIAYKHCSPAEPMIVTASVDRVCMLKRIDEIHKYNLMLSGSVTWVGRSSMEISIKASAIQDGFPDVITESFVKTEDVFLSANFTFVARNPETHKSFPINRLLPLNEKEWKDFTRAESHNAAKKLRKNLTVNPPNFDESVLMHNLWKASNKLELFKKQNKTSKNLKFMSDTVLKSVMFMQPQYRNRHSYMIFGGYLMKEAFELAYCSAAAFSHAPPRFISLDTTSFTAPVPVGSVLYLKSKVVYTEHITNDSEKEPVDADVCTDKLAADDPCGNSISEEELNELFTFYGKTTSNQLSKNPSDFLGKPGTVIQVRVDTSVRSLNHDIHRKTGSFIYSFFVPKYTYENENLGISNLNMDQKVVKNGYYAVVPNTYSEMVEFVQGKQRSKETADSVRQLKQRGEPQSKL